MKNSFSFIFCLIAMASYSQNTLNAGGWSTSGPGSYTRITATNNLDQKVYSIQNTIHMDDAILEFEIIVDGVTIPTKIYEGGVVAVEGKSIFIRQTKPGKQIKGNWKTIQQPETAATVIPWVGYPSLNKEILVASLKTEQEFIIEIHGSLDCNDAAFQVFIDNVPVKDSSNNTLTFWNGSSLIGKGKLVVVKVSGSCTGSKIISGYLKLKA
ncbi:hypothetical protein MH928_06585 [Flavobacterium sp. WW92]|uniref:hypothetical protein n=1 Tax=unclassified Flavobacterium TaxID=196869 RepID=UPI002224FCB1|nr:MULTISPECIES: hypothetical protein [unclassified Flavobacterium]WDO14357.1 hypothetical protein MH928_06585 [Flavobacterium sp. WW92]